MAEASITMGYTGDAAMSKLAEQTGGRVINVGNNGKKLEAAFDAIEQELRTEYVASYTPTNTNWMAPIASWMST